MNKTQDPLPFEIVMTKDGSPSLAFFKGEHSQMMHSTEGAYSETEYVYGKALDAAFTNFDTPKVLSVGLGFGYVELSTAVRAINKNAHLTSYEKEPLLKDSWQNYIDRKGVPETLLQCYDKIFSIYSEQHQISKEDLRNFFNKDQFSLRGALDILSPPKETFNCILFDPFCSKFSPEFWGEKALANFLILVSQPQAIFATYAATGALNRALVKAGFKKQKQKGFGVKREFTLAIRP